MMTVAEYIASFLVEKGVKHIFGFQGSAILNIIDACVSTRKITYIQNFNEQASAFCADAYARTNSKIGVAMATSGPGAINLLNGIANAYFDSIPTLFITGQERIDSINSKKEARQNAFQDVDIVKMAKPITKYSKLIEKASDIRYELEKAYHIATSERKGSVLLDIPIDIQFQRIETQSLHSYTPDIKKNSDIVIDQINLINSKLENAKRPLLLVGGGIQLANATDELACLVSKTQIPVVTTLNGSDACFPTLGFSGLYGNTSANLALLKADLVIALGTRFGAQQIGKEKHLYSNAEFIRIEIDENEKNRTFIKESIFVNVDVKEFLKLIIPRLPTLNFSLWRKITDEWKLNLNKKSLTNNLDPIELIHKIVELSSEKQIMTSDVGCNQMWLAQGFSAPKKQRLYNSSGLGAMGYSLPAAIGASYLSDKSVICFTGDGGLQMNLQELNTLSIRRNNVKCIVFNNNILGLMKFMQDKHYNSRYTGTMLSEFTCPNLEKLADVFSLNYAKILSMKDFHKIKEAFTDDKPWIIEVVLPQDLSAHNRFDDEDLLNA